MSAELKIMTKDQLREKVPAIFTKEPSERMSERYVYIPSEKVVDTFASEGWFPTKAFQSKTKKDDRIFRKHTIEFASPTFQPLMPEVGTLTPRLIMTNSHDGTSGIQLRMGIFRLVCSNGLCVAHNEIMQIRKRHSGIERDEILETIYNAGKQFPDVWSKIDEYRSIKLTNNQRIDFATKVVNLRFGDQAEKYDATSFLEVMREEDREPNLFNTFNILQEHVIKGGIEYKNTRTDRMRKVRRLTNMNRELELNVALWAMMENFRVNQRFA